MTQLLSQDKWDRAKKILDWVWSVIRAGEGKIDFKRLESDRGFLIYALRGYPWMKPYLKGFHATLDSWRLGRDKEGWKLKKLRLKSKTGEEEEDYFLAEEKDKCDTSTTTLRM